MIEPGSRIPSVPVRLLDGRDVIETTSDLALAGGLVVFFTVPGAFTPTCHVNHVPGFLANAGKLRSAGVNRIVCGAVNDHHTIKAWAEALDAVGVIAFVADPKGELAKAMGLERTTDDLGLRFRRSASIVRDGIIEAVFVEDKPGVSATGAGAILMALSAAA